MFKKFIIDTAYFLNTSKKYNSRKLFFRNILENSNFKYKKYVDLLMITLIFISVIVLIREVKHHTHDFMLFFSNYIISAIFFVEYMLRLWTSSSISKLIVERAEHDTFLARDIKLSKAIKKIIVIKFKYILSVTAIIDLLAILPFFHELRLLRIFILFRVFKLFRYAKSFQTLISVLSSKKFEFLTLAIFSFIVIFVSSVIIYVMEGNNAASPIKTMYEALYWSIITISTVGYGDIVPVTDEGRFVAMLVIVAGIAVLAFTTSLVVSAFTEKMDEIKEVKTIEDISKLKNFYLVCGYEAVAKEVVKKLLKNKDINIVIIDSNESRVLEAKKDGLKALNYDTGSVDSYKNLGIDLQKQVKAILCLYENDINNVYTALTVRFINKEVKIFSLLIDSLNRKKLKFAGIDTIICPQELIGLITKELVGKPVAFRVIHELRSENEYVKIDEIAVTQRIIDNFSIVGELGNRSYRVIVLGLFKNKNSHFYFNPIPDTILEQGDYILVVGYKVFIKEFEKHLHTRVKNV